MNELRKKKIEVIKAFKTELIFIGALLLIRSVAHFISGSFWGGVSEACFGTVIILMVIGAYNEESKQSG
jgi:hypothetical protein